MNEEKFEKFLKLETERLNSVQSYNKKVNALLILNEMATNENEVYTFPLSDNLEYARTGKDGWGELHIAIPNRIIANIDKYIGALFLANRDQYVMCEKTLQCLEAPALKGGGSSHAVMEKEGCEK